MSTITTVPPGNVYSVLNDKINDLSSRTENYKTQVNIAGGVFIGVLVVLIIAFLSLCFKMSNMRKSFEKRLDEADPLKRYTMKRPNVNHGYTYDPDLVLNRFSTSEANYPKLFDTGSQYTSPDVRPSRLSSNNNEVYFFNPGSSRKVEMNPTPKSFLHESSHRDNTILNNW
ncbi:hypothetical protein JTB14_025868 [Gonioctena quinquepunctata]|nr:hypothetical protein JTB14_025868 [Gonioctena quinquepunctata]